MRDTPPPSPSLAVLLRARADVPATLAPGLDGACAEATGRQRASPIPAFARARSPGSRRSVSVGQCCALIGLTLLLAVQLLWAERARLAADARWRPLLEGVCARLGCPLPAWHEPGAFALFEREVRPLAGHAGVLQVRVSFRNDARWPQAWPALRLSLSDVDGRLIGSRLWTPREYLGRAPTDSERLLPAQSARLVLRVREPAVETAAFAFELR